MDTLSVVSDSDEVAEGIRRELAGAFATHLLARRDLCHAEPTRHVVIDIDLNSKFHLTDIRQWLTRLHGQGKTLFVVDLSDRLQVAQAFAIGATDLIGRPVSRAALLTKLFGDIVSLAETTVSPSETPAGFAAGTRALQSVFISALTDTP